jgi:Ion channel
MLDDRARRDRKEKQIEACPNCARIRIANECNARNNRREFRAGSNSIHSNRRHLSERFASEGSPSKAPAAVLSPTRHSLPPPPPTAPIWSDQDKPIGRQATPSYDSMEDMSHDYSIGHDLMSSPTMPSPMQFLGRQSHTRHASFDISQHQNLLGGGPAMSYGTNPPATRTSLYSQSSMTNESNSAAMFKPSTNKLRTIASSDNLMDGFSESDNDESSVTSSSTESSTEEVWDSAKSRIQAGKYVFVTLRLALLNSLVIIAVGCIGFWVIEGFSLVDSWYFATVLLTTVGYVASRLHVSKAGPTIVVRLTRSFSGLQVWGYCSRDGWRQTLCNRLHPRGGYDSVEQHVVY